jgi:hypothetical protein
LKPPLCRNRDMDVQSLHGASIPDVLGWLIWDLIFTV